MVGVRASLKLEAAAEIFFFSEGQNGARFNQSFLRILENAISSGKYQTNKKATGACLKVYRKTHEIHGTKVP